MSGRRIRVGCGVLMALWVTMLPKAYADEFIPIISFAAGFLNKGIFPESEAYTTDDAISIEAEDGVNLEANIFVPTQLTELAPAVVLINSWGFNEYQYLTQAAVLAENGYIVLSYTSRGFGTSGGQIDTAGPKDLADFGRVIDFLIANYPVDPDAIAAGGISYGSGIALLGAAQDNRIKAVAAMSTWGSLVESFYAGQTPREVWLQLLRLVGELQGDPDPIIEQHVQTLRNQDLAGIPEVIAWAEPRSPINYVEQLNQHGTAVYFSKAYGDDLFAPNSVLDMYAQLTGPKYMDLVPGTHATAELAPTLQGFGEDLIWDNVYAWLDHHLKGEDNAIANALPVNMRVKFQSHTDRFADYPLPSIQHQRFYLHPRSLFKPGGLQDYPYDYWFALDNTINALTGSLFSTNIPLLSQVLEQYQVPSLAKIPLSPPQVSIYFESDWLSRELQIRGEPSLTLQVQPKHTSAQLVAYLYDMNALGVGRLVTHGVVTLPQAEPGAKVTLDIEFVTTAYDVPEGHKVVLAIDTRDPHYKTPTDVPYFIDFEFSAQQASVLQLPLQ